MVRGDGKGNQLTFMLPSRLARSMTRNFLMRSLGGEKRKKVSNCTAYSASLKNHSLSDYPNVFDGLSKMTNGSFFKAAWQPVRSDERRFPKEKTQTRPFRDQNAIGSLKLNSGEKKNL